MFNNLKKRIKEIGYNMVFEGISRWQANSEKDINSIKDEMQAITARLSSLTEVLEGKINAPYDLGYFTDNYGPYINQKSIEHGKLFANRSLALPYMPKNAVCAEVGVAYGDFSQQILDIMIPAELHLIDSYQIRSGVLGKGFFQKKWFRS